MVSCRLEELLLDLGIRGARLGIDCTLVRYTGYLPGRHLTGCSQRLGMDCTLIGA